MTTEHETKSSRQFTGVLLPWLLAAGLLVIYLLTLSPWLDSNNLLQVSNLSGWNWHPNIFAPVTAVLTSPLHWVPKSWVPFGLNLFTAICGALILALLARSVALLPYDRTHDQREREFSPNKRLTIRAAWLPPVFAVLVCGCGLSFWQGSTQGGTDLVDLLLFAYVVRCLLEYRLAQRDSWMFRFALAYGLAIANSWVMVLFFPPLLVAVVWIKGVGFFRLQFLARFAACWLAGISAILLLPIIVSLTHPTHFGIWSMVRYLLGVYKSNATVLPRGLIAGLCLASLLPITLIGIRWKSFYSDTSKLGVLMSTGMLHIVHGALLLFCIWSALDTPLSPRALVPMLSLLPLYYLGALSVGYFAGYFLLVFGVRANRGRQRRSPGMDFLNKCLVISVWVLFVAGPGLLIYKNLPVILRGRHGALSDYAQLLERSLPPAGAVILSDDPLRLYYLHALLNRRGKDSEYLIVDTTALKQDPDYFNYLDHRHPQFKLANSLTNQVSELADTSGLIRLFANLSRTHDLYYVQPSFGYYFEEFYPRSQGLFYRLNAYPKGEFLVPSMSQEQVQETGKFWDTWVEENLPGLRRQLRPALDHGPIAMFLELIRAPLEPDLEAREAGNFYSRAFNYWGVELQRQQLLKPAAKAFEQALELNPDNAAAQINLACNQNLQAGTTNAAKSAKAIEEIFGKRRRWDQVLQDDGPFDDASFCFQLGETFYRAGLYRQAIQQFERTRSLAPDHTNARLWLAELYEIRFIQSYTNSIARADEVLALVPSEPTALFLKAGALMEMKAYDRAIPLLTDVLKVQTNNLGANLNRAIAYLQLGNLAEARKDYELIAESAPKTYQAYFGLGEIAYRNKDISGATKNYQLYLTNAPPNTEEFKMISARLKEISPGTP